MFDHRLLAERFVAAMNANDRAGLAALVTEDFVTEWPQSGERVRGLDNFWAILDNYPGGRGGTGNDAASLQHLTPPALKLIAPSYTVVTVDGAGTTGTFALKAIYPDGSHWRVITLYRLRGERMAFSTTYFAPDFPAPEWRAAWVERMD